MAYQYLKLTKVEVFHLKREMKKGLSHSDPFYFYSISNYSPYAPVETKVGWFGTLLAAEA